MKICCVFNFASHYRKMIFELLEKELDVDFYFGKSIQGNIKSIDYKDFKNIKGFITPKKIGPALFYKNFLELFKRNNYTHFLVTGEPRNISLWITMLYCRVFAKKNISLWTHGWYGNENLVNKFVKKLFFSLADHIFVYGTYAKRMMEAEKISGNKISPIYNSLDYDLHLSLRKECIDNPKVYSDIFGNLDNTICYIGRIQEVKKIDLVLQALYLLKENNVSVNFMVIGSGDYIDTLKCLSAKLDLSKQICFYGACYDECLISKFIYNSSLVVSPGNIGLTAIHALSYGTPALTHSDFSNQMPEFESIKPDVSGDFFEKNNIEDLALKIKKWISYDYAILRKDEIRKNCIDIIDTTYNPYNQIAILKEYFYNENPSN